MDLGYWWLKWSYLAAAVVASGILGMVLRDEYYGDAVFLIVATCIVLTIFGLGSFRGWKHKLVVLGVGLAWLIATAGPMMLIFTLRSD